MEYFVESLQICETSDDEYFVEGVQVCEDSGGAGPVASEFPFARYYTGGGLTV